MIVTLMINSVTIYLYQKVQTICLTKPYHLSFYSCDLKAVWVRASCEQSAQQTGWIVNNNTSRFAKTRLLRTTQDNPRFSELKSRRFLPAFYYYKFVNTNPELKICVFIIYMVQTFVFFKCLNLCIFFRIAQFFP